MKRTVASRMLAALALSMLAGGTAFAQMTYQEAPMLAAMVEAGDLPPVAERLPSNPLVVEPFDSIGTYSAGPIRMMDVSDRMSIGLRVRHTGLFRYNQTASAFEADLAESHSWSNENRTLTLKLREGLRWSDGEPFTTARHAVQVGAGHPQRRAQHARHRCVLHPRRSPRRLGGAGRLHPEHHLGRPQPGRHGPLRAHPLLRRQRPVPARALPEAIPRRLQRGRRRAGLRAGLRGLGGDVPGARHAGLHPVGGDHRPPLHGHAHAGGGGKRSRAAGAQRLLPPRGHGRQPASLRRPAGGQTRRRLGSLPPEGVGGRGGLSPPTTPTHPACPPTRPARRRATTGRSSRSRCAPRSWCCSSTTTSTNRC